MSAKPDAAWHGVQPSALEVYRLGLLRAASHHLPSVPPLNPWDCLAFRQISHRLIGWDRLYSDRTGQEYIFQNYFDEASIAPEVFYPPYPAPPVALDWFTAPLVSDTVICSNPSQNPPVEKQGQAGNFQAHETCISSYETTDSSTINSDDCHEDSAGGGVGLGRNVSHVGPPLRFLDPAPLADPFHFGAEGAHHHHNPFIHNISTPDAAPASSFSCHPRYRKSHLIDASFDSLVQLKRRRILPA
ncbi:hypothetical protein VP01_293g9 [Puccinia sorghi]|uniref:Uncharacterized protein n=1 Tax=Puccinia sorghi TaxID=27349 RepID=A0A0L6V1V3_9BASI|nr:hypothetical protein VP01_293g9 [Puccinia sorghi]